MTPKQKELLVSGLLSDLGFLEGSGNYSAARSLLRKGWIRGDGWRVNRNSITQEGIDALRDNSPPTEIYDCRGQVLILRHGRPIARAIPGQIQHVEEMLNELHQDL